MSYVRWSFLDKPHPYDSALYIYSDVQGGITCCGCCLNDGGEFNVPTAAEMVAHVREHIAAGDAVPDFVIPRIEADAAFIESE